MKRLTFALCLFLAAVGAVAAAAPVADGGARQRMEERLPALRALKQRKAVGENNQGYLEVRGSVSADEAKLVEGENSDRGTAYAALAVRANTTKEVIGRERAKSLAAAAATGDLVQGADGRWVEKR